MRTVLALVALVALCLASDETDIYDATGYYDIDIPKDGQYKFLLSVSDAAKTLGAVGVEIHVDMNTDWQDRKIVVYADTAAISSVSGNGSHTYTWSSSKNWVYNFASTKRDTRAATSVYFTLVAKCDYSCKKSITSDVWVRLVNSSSSYIYDVAYTDTSRLPKLVENMRSSKFDLPSKSSGTTYNYHKIQYVNSASNITILPVRLYHTTGSTVHLLGGKSNDAAVTVDNLQWTQEVSKQSHSFAASSTTTMAVYSTLTITGTWSLCVGSCSAAAGPAAVSFLLLFLAAAVSLF